MPIACSNLTVEIDHSNLKELVYFLIGSLKSYVAIVSQLKMGAYAMHSRFKMIYSSEMVAIDKIENADKNQAAFSGGTSGGNKKIPVVRSTIIGTFFIWFLVACFSISLFGITLV
jgi:hypothetical protein